MVRPLPSAEEAARILSARRTRPVRPPPPGAARALAGTLKALEAKFGKSGDGLKARWREVVGEALAARTEPARLTGGRGGSGATLELRVEGAWATLVQHQAGEILERVNLFMGEGAVARLRFQQGPLRKAPARAPGRLRAAGPLDAAEEQALARELQDLRHDGLRDALTRLGREVRRREGRGGG